MKFMLIQFITICCYLNAYGYNIECLGTFSGHYKKANLEYATTTVDNLSGPIKELRSLSYTNGVQIYELTIQGEFKKPLWSKNPSPYARATEVLTTYFGRVRLHNHQAYFIFNEQGSRRLFEAYQDHLNSPLEATAEFKTIEEIVLQQDTLNKQKASKQLITISSNNKSVVPKKVKKHIISFYQKEGFIFVRMTDIYKNKQKKDVYLTFIKADTDLKSFNSLVQTLIAHNGLNVIAEKHLLNSAFKIARTHPLFYIQQELKKQKPWYKNLFKY